MFDKILVMTDETIMRECLKYGLQVVNKKIQNQQTLIGFFNSQEKKMLIMEAEQLRKQNILDQTENNKVGNRQPSSSKQEQAAPESLKSSGAEDFFAQAAEESSNDFSRLMNLNKKQEKKEVVENTTSTEEDINFEKAVKQTNRDLSRIKGLVQQKNELLSTIDQETQPDTSQDDHFGGIQYNIEGELDRLMNKNQKPLPEENIENAAQATQPISYTEDNLSYKEKEIEQKLINILSKNKKRQEAEPIMEVAKGEKQAEEMKKLKTDEYFQNALADSNFDIDRLLNLSKLVPETEQKTQDEQEVFEEFEVMPQLSFNAKYYPQVEIHTEKAKTLKTPANIQEYQQEDIIKNMHKFTKDQVLEFVGSKLRSSQNSDHVNSNLLRYYSANIEAKEIKKQEKELTSHFTLHSDKIFKQLGSSQDLEPLKWLDQFAQLVQKHDLPKLKWQTDIVFDNLKRKQADYQSLDVQSFNTNELLLVAKYLLGPLKIETETSFETLNYRVLNSLLEQYQKTDRQLVLNKQDLLLVIEKCNEIYRNKELQNQLRIALLTNSFRWQTIDDIQSVASALMSKHHEQESHNLMKKGRLDNKILSYEPMRIALNQVTSQEDVKKIIDLQKMILDSNIEFGESMSLINEGYYEDLVTMCQLKEVDLNDLVRQSSISFHNSYKNRTFLFPEMLSKTTQNFSSHVQPENLLEFCTKMTYIANIDKFLFEHLQTVTNSTWHLDNKPFSQTTFNLIERIVEDLLAHPVQLHSQQLEALMKLFSCEKFVKRYFNNVEEIERVQSFLIDNTKKLLGDKLKNQAELGEKFWQDLLVSSRLLSTNDKNSKKLQKMLIAVTERLDQDIDSSKIKNPSMILNINQEMLKISQQIPIKEYNDSKFYAQADLIVNGILSEKKTFKLKGSKQEINPSSLINDVGPVLTHVLQKATDSSLEGAKRKKLHKNFASYINSMPNLRTLKHNDIITLFAVVKEMYATNPVTKTGLDLQDSKFLNQCSEPLMLVASNLNTVYEEKFMPMQKNSDVEDPQINPEIATINESIQNLERENIRMIMNTYFDLYLQNQEIFHSQKYTLRPLNSLMAKEVDTLPNNLVLRCLQIFKGYDINNFNREFLSKLYLRYSQQSEIKELSLDPTFLLEFGDNWPFFLKNNFLIEELINLTQTSLILEQTKALRILSDKNMFHPDLLLNYQKAFLKLTDKTMVKKTLKDFLHICSYIGYVKGIDPIKLSTTIRRVYKSPKDMEITQLLDFFLILAETNADFEQFDVKTKTFIKESLDHIENNFQGYITINHEKPLNNGTQETEKIELQIFPSIRSDEKTFNKQMYHNIRTFNQKVDNKSEELLLTNTMKKFQAFKQKQKQNSESQEDITHIDDQEIIEKLTPGIEAEELDEIILENQFERENEIFEEEEDILESPSGDENPEVPDENLLKVYDARQKEGRFNEEFAYQNSRIREFGSLQKWEKHALMFTNSDDLNLVKINSNNNVKAWTVLYHFRSKELDSHIFQEFNSIVTRNMLNKAKGHELFDKFCKTIQNMIYDKNLRMKVSQNCEKTGWPIDLLLEQKYDETQRVVLYFLLQEEGCYNMDSGMQQPLLIQKIMLKHLKNIGGLNVKVIFENAFLEQQFNNEESREKYCDQLLDSLF